MNLPCRPADRKVGAPDRCTTNLQFFAAIQGGDENAVERLLRDAIRVLDLLRVGSYWFRVDVVDQ